MPSSKNTVLQLFPPKIQGQSNPAMGANIGAPLSAVTIYPPDYVFKRARAWIDPPLSGSLDIDDEVLLWMALVPTHVGPVKDRTSKDAATAPILLDSVTITGNVNDPIDMYIASNAFLVGVVMYLFYTIERKSENIGTSTSVSCIYNRIRPGFKDDLTVPGGHSELALLLPDAIKNGVGADFTNAQVAVEYPYCRAFDRISLLCNGEIMDIIVKSTEAPEPPHHGSEAVSKIYFNVDRAFLERAKRLDQKLNFLFTVSDQLLNTADPDAPWSAPQTVDEDLDGLRLPKPVLLEKMEDFPIDDHSIIDLKKLGQNPLLLIIATGDDRFLAGDDIVATYTAKISGQDDVVVTVSGKVEAPLGQKVPCILEVPNNKVFASSVVEAKYELHRPTPVRVAYSQTANAQVVGARVELEAPTIREAPDSTTLDPFAAKDTLTCIVPIFTDMIGKQLCVIWAGTQDGGSHTTEAIAVTKEEPQHFSLPNSLVAHNLGETVWVSYAVIGKSEPQGSKPLVLKVQRIADGDTNLPTPRIDGAMDDELDVTSLADNAQLRIAKWALQAQGQIANLRYDGFDSEGKAVEKVLLADVALQQTSGLAIAALLEWLRGLLNGSLLKIYFELNYENVANLKTRVQFPTTTYAVKTLVEIMPEINSVTRLSSGEQIPEGAEIIETAVKLSGVASKNQFVKIFDGLELQDRVKTTDAGDWTLILGDLGLSLHTITVKADYGSGMVSAPRTFSTTAAGSGFENFEAETVGRIALNSPVKLRSGLEFTSISLNGDGKCAFTNNRFPQLKVRIYLPDLSRSRFKLNGSATKIQFLIGNNVTTNRVVFFFNQAGVCLHEDVLPVTPINQNDNIDGSLIYNYHSSTDARVSYFEIEVGEGRWLFEGIFIDDIKWLD